MLPAASVSATLTVAREHAGVNSNVLTDEDVVEPLSGTAVLNGIPVELEAADRVPEGAGVLEQPLA